MANYAIILAAGDGKRFGSKTPKCFIKINKTPLYQFALNTFCQIKQFKTIVLVVPKAYENKINLTDRRMLIVCGGKTRNESFEKGIKALQNLQANDKILIHDAARTDVAKSDILKLIKSKESYGTLCVKGQKNQRDLRVQNLNILTPQFCKYSIYKKAKNKDKNGKDLFTYLNLKPTPKSLIFSTSPLGNFKITFKGDLKLV